MTNLEALKRLFVALGGAEADVVNTSTLADMIAAIAAQIEAGGGGGESDLLVLRPHESETSELGNVGYTLDDILNSGKSAILSLNNDPAPYLATYVGRYDGSDCLVFKSSDTSGMQSMYAVTINGDVVDFIED